MKNLKLAAKIGIGFGIVIAIAVALGAVSILSMTGVLGDARRLAVESVPLVTVANNVERAALHAMLNMRGYALSGNAEYGKLAKENLADVKKHLIDATELVGKYPRLSYLKSAAASSQAKVEEYSKQAERTETLMKGTADARNIQEEAATIFMKGCFQYLDSQNQQMKDEIARRLSAASLQTRAKKIAAINEIIDMGYDLRIANLKAQAYSDPSILEKGLEPFAGLAAKLDAIRAATVLQTNKDQLAEIQKSADNYVAACDTLLANMKEMAALDESRNTVAQGVLDDAEGAALAGLKDAQNVSALAVARLISAVIILIVGLSCAAIIGIAVAIAITRTITKPLTKGVSFAQIVASGDLTQLLDIRQRDEVGVLAGALNGMAQKLKDMVASVQQNALQVASSSEEISASAQKLAEGAQTQASTLEETSAAVEELASSVDQVAEHAQSQAAAVEQGSASMAQVQKSIEEVSTNLAEISDLASKSVDNALQGGKAVQEVVDGITAIAASSERIGGIINVISDIADQTNLLALNASIEAARAGEHGRGFAVVADEVSKLAERSATSTKEIETLIKESIKSITQGVTTAQGSQGAMDQIRAASQTVKDMIGALSEAMKQQVAAIHELAAALDKVSDMSQSISAATEEQTTSARQVSKAVENVNDITQGAASAAEEMSSATEQLSEMAQQLQRLMEQFKVTGDGSREGKQLVARGQPSGDDALSRAEAGKARLHLVQTVAGQA